ncbi:D-alanyl-D-alanine carboxypeptidase [uncultured Caudovirales phage]|uniref:D-alanyl-D-alanine carboxypeptidase n=1 Tax=uncultured Caudovirales phage TaxID=2100421 RepID=A0A6J5PSI0_9CAUD|nr:D-alanyl-D-alanine carboxypeptidase [uncultured Caudovirales phage]CAB4199765.1 D-alanyl-D-alanine carboxypeptidase [uncultured Caudovirales phage]CAB5238558.1 D-alanyl-D-alanine carboxypeptidase [uncultured Caudovirales phage]
MNREEIQDIQRKIGTEPDGFWGPKSIAACQRHLRSLMPVPNPWPETDQRNLTAFFGESGDESQLVNLPAPEWMTYEGVKVKTIRCNRRVADSLGRVLIKVSEIEGFQPIVYDGCYNNRPVRGGNLPSLHARGAAIDLCADTNGNLTSWPVAARMPLEVMEAFAREGWLSAGAFWQRDAMHFQATR